MVSVKSTTALLFDMDGVIIDSTALHVDSWKKYLAERGIEADNLQQRMLGKHNAELVLDLFAGRELSDELIFQHGARKEALYREMLRPVFQEKLVPGVIDFIRRHRQQPMAVASNAEPANLDLILELAGVRDCFGAVVDGQQVSRPKPHPDIYLRAAGLLGTQPEHCIVFEDSATGIAAARAAQMRVVALKTTVDAFEGVDLDIVDFLDPGLEKWLAASA